jgi:sec-independent protein translocase protein TatA
MMFGLGIHELLIIAGVLTMLFGAKKLPELGRGFGGFIRELKQVKREIGDIDDEVRRLK